MPLTHNQQRGVWPHLHAAQQVGMLVLQQRPVQRGLREARGQSGNGLLARWRAAGSGCKRHVAAALGPAA